jgi:aspartyl-tRNA(Asn)/glutamyl-tRNA(Gln) amidotransferase subunit C
LSLTKEEVEHIGQLAKLGLTEDEVVKFQGQLSEILGHFDALQELDTDDVPPTPYPLPLENVMRNDVVKDSLSREDVLANAPLSEDGAFRVRAVLDE